MKDPRRQEVELAQDLNRRVGTVLGSIPGSADLPSGAVPCPALDEDGIPSWLRIPLWLDDAWAAEGSPPPSGWDLTELLWGQYALFLSLRMKDDLLDGERDDLRLLFVADGFLFASMESFQRFPELDAGFWAFYRRSVRATLDGALEVGRLEREPGRFTTEHLELHAKVCSAMKVGVTALCRLYGHDQDREWLSRLQDRIAIVNQVVDDVNDLPDDLRVGRYTWVANTVLGLAPGESLAPDAWAHRLGAGLMEEARGAQVVEELRRAVRAAAAEVPVSAPQPIREMVERLAGTPTVLDELAHETRVRWVFKGFLEAAET